MKILITGSSGRVGSAIAKSLSQTHQLIGIDKIAGPQTSHVMDLLSSHVKPIANSVDVIIHCAALHAPHVGKYSEQSFWDANVGTTQRLLNFSSKDTQFILTSTTSVFGDAMDDTEKAIWIDESVTPQPRDIYDVTKLAAEELLYDECDNSGNGERNGVVLRISRCFPEREDLMAIYRTYRGVDLRDVAQAHEQSLTRILVAF